MDIEEETTKMRESHSFSEEFVHLLVLFKSKNEQKRSGWWSVRTGICVYFPFLVSYFWKFGSPQASASAVVCVCAGGCQHPSIAHRCTGTFQLPCYTPSQPCSFFKQVLLCRRLPPYCLPCLSMFNIRCRNSFVKKCSRNFTCVGYIRLCIDINLHLSPLCRNMSLDYAGTPRLWSTCQLGLCIYLDFVLIRWCLVAATSVGTTHEERTLPLSLGFCFSSAIIKELKSVGPWVDRIAYV